MLTWLMGYTPSVRGITPEAEATPTAAPTAPGHTTPRPSAPGNTPSGHTPPGHTSPGGTVLGGFPAELSPLPVQVERLPALNTPREGHAVFLAGGQLVVAGGHTAGFVPTATAEYLSGGKWHEVPMTYPHDHGTALVLRNGKVLLAGGSKEEMGVGQTFGAELYDPESHSFSGFGCLNRKRTLASAIELDSGKVMITGNWYADDDIELFDGQRFFMPGKPVSVGRVVPYLFRTSQGDVLIVSDRDTYDRLADTVVIDRLNGEPFTVPLLQQWKPLTYNAPTTADVGFIGDEAQGRFAYLMAVRNFERTRQKPELEGQPPGQMAIALVEDTVFTLLPTTCPIPMMSPLGTGPIFYDRGYIMADRRAQRAYFCGIDKDKRLYVVGIGYTQRPAPLTLYYTDPLPDCGFYVPALTADGDLAIIGGSCMTDYDSDNFQPTSSAWLVRLGHDETVSAIGQGPASRLWWLLPLGVLLAGIALLAVRKRSAPNRFDAPDTPHAEADETPHWPDADSQKSREELMSRVCRLMEEQQLFRSSDLKTADVAARLGTNSRYVTDCIKDSCNMTFTQFVNKYRIDYAIGLLRQNPNRKILELYTDAGFSSERSFYRVFKEVTGLTTTDWLSQNIG